MEKLEMLMIESKPTSCSQCGDRVFYIGKGKYICRTCESMNFDIYGKVRNFMRKNEKSSILYMSQAIGVDEDVIEMILGMEQVPILKDSKYFLECIHCGCSIRDGKSCAFCKREVAGDIRGLMYEDFQRKRRILNPEMAGKMHYKKRY